MMVPRGFRTMIYVLELNHFTLSVAFLRLLLLDEDWAAQGRGLVEV